MRREPPAEVRRQLRQEIGFGCPAPGCGSPYLRWHHFDPPWREKKHHNPSGMIALCGEHHDKADAGAYTKEQLRQFKHIGAEQAEEVKGRFDWMRHSLLAVVGGNFYYETPTMVEFRGDPMIWFNRDEEGYLLLNIRMLSTSKQPRMRIEDNFWLTRGAPDDLESPPSGKRLRVKYSNEDMLKIQFHELESAAATQKRYPDTNPQTWDVPFPITAVEVHSKVGGTNLKFGPRATTVGGVTISGSFAKNCRVGLALG